MLDWQVGQVNLKGGSLPAGTPSTASPSRRELNTGLASSHGLTFTAPHLTDGACHGACHGAGSAATPAAFAPPTPLLVEALSALLGPLLASAVALRRE